MRLAAVFLASAMALWAADPPKDVLQFLRSAAEDLADQNPTGFLDHFDSNLPGMSTLRDEVSVLAQADVESTIEFVSDEGNDERRDLQLDWLLRVNGGRPKHQLVQCRIEKQGKKWKITELKPIEFFAVS
jgi:hypothetical protein